MTLVLLTLTGLASRLSTVHFSRLACRKAGDTRRFTAEKGKPPSSSGSTSLHIRGGSIAIQRVLEADVSPDRVNIHDHPVPLLAGQSCAHAGRFGRHRPDSASAPS